jgi:hypothetical protein
VPDLSLQIISHKHLRKSSCSVVYSCPILQLGLCRTQPAEYRVQLRLCPHRLLLLHTPVGMQIGSRSSNKCGTLHLGGKDLAGHFIHSRWLACVFMRSMEASLQCQALNPHCAVLWQSVPRGYIVSCLNQGRQGRRCDVEALNYSKANSPPFLLIHLGWKSPLYGGFWVTPSNTCQSPFKTERATLRLGALASNSM